MFKMWRLQTLLSYVRGGVRSHGWRVCEPHSKLVSDDREPDSADPPLPQAGDGPRANTCAARGRRLLSPQSPAQALYRHVHAAPRTAVANACCGAGTVPSASSLWYLNVGLQPVDSTTSRPVAGVDEWSDLDVASSASVRSDCADSGLYPSEEDGNTSEQDKPPGALPDQLDTFESVHIAFTNENNRLMAELQNSVGAGVAVQRPAEALECFRRAAARGSAAGWYNTGVCFQQGIGTQADTQRAAVCYEEAAWLGHATAAYNLAVLRAATPLTSQGSDDVTRLLRQAAASGSEEAAAYLPIWRAWSDALDSDGAPVTPDSPLTRSWSLPTFSDSDYDSGPGERDSSFGCDRARAGTRPVLCLNEVP